MYVSSWTGYPHQPPRVRVVRTNAARTPATKTARARGLVIERTGDSIVSRVDGVLQQHGDRQRAHSSRHGRDPPGRGCHVVEVDVAHEGSPAVRELPAASSRRAPEGSRRRRFQRSGAG